MINVKEILDEVDNQIGRASMDLGFAAMDLGLAGPEYAREARRLRELSDELDEIMGELRR